MVEAGGGVTELTPEGESQEEKEEKENKLKKVFLSDVQTKL